MLVVDFEKLQVTIDHMVKFDREVTECLDVVDHTTAALRATWHGEAADSQAQAQGQWDTGAEQMKTALEQLTKIAEVARANYSNAVTISGQMWG